MSVINVQDYGAIADADYYNPDNFSYYADASFTITPTDNTQSFRDALTAAQTGDTVYIPNGTYMILGSLVVPTGVILEGENEHLCKIVLGNNFTLDSFYFRATASRTGNVQAIIATADNSQNIIMRNFTLEGNKNTVIYSDWGMAGILCQKTTNVKLEYVHVNWINIRENLSTLFEGWSITSVDADGIEFYRCSGEYSGYQIFGFFDRSSNGLMHECTSGMGWRTSVQVHRDCANIDLLNNTIIQEDNDFENEPNAAVTFHGEEAEEVRNITLDGNYIECGMGYKAAVQSFRQSIGLNVTNNEIKTNSIGVYLGDADGATVENNKVYKMQDTVPTAYGEIGIDVIDNTLNSVVRYNMISGFGTPLSIDATSSAEIYDNTIKHDWMRETRFMKNDRNVLVEYDGVKKVNNDLAYYNPTLLY